MEVAVLVAVVSAMLAGMAVYYKRSVCGYVRRARENLNTQPYAPGRVTGQTTVSVNGHRHNETFLERIARVDNKTDTWVVSVQGQQVSFRRDGDAFIVEPGPYGAPDTTYGSTPMVTSISTQETLSDDQGASLFAR